MDLEPTTQRAIEPAQDDGWRNRALMTGGLVGAVLGVLSAYLYVRSADETKREAPPEGPQAGDAVKLGISLLTIIRTIADWGKR